MDIFDLMKKHKIRHLVFTQKDIPDLKNLKKTSSYKYLLSMIKKYKHEEVHFCYDAKTKARFIVGVHNTYRGPSLGGFRLWQYKNEKEALKDVLRLSRGMTYKSAAVGLKLGGGKAICWLQKNQKKNKALLKAYSKFLPFVCDKYITAEDVGSTVPDMDFLDKEVRKIKGHKKKCCVVCCSLKKGGSDNPSPFTAIGVYDGIKLTVQKVLKKKTLKGIKVAIQGMGNVGRPLAEMLLKDNAILFITNRSQGKIDSFLKYAKKHKKLHLVKPVSMDEIYSVDCDVFSPCALGAIINDKTIHKLKCKIIAGSANNQLEDEVKHGKILRKKGIVYAPDFMINAGGVSNAYFEYYAKTKGGRYSKKKANELIEKISRNLIKVYNLADKKKIPTSLAANQLAGKRFKIRKK